MKDSVIDKFHEAIKQYSMLDGKRSVLVGFSGGADSTALLYLLSQLKTVKVYAAHVNHSIRGMEADRDENFCVDFCLRHNIPIFHTKINVPLLSKESGLGIEETARAARYSYFDKIISDNDIDCIATAHNASDNTETVLMNLIRGTSTTGICGIPPVRQNIIRPLILCPKDRITDFCVNNGIDFVSDSTNSSTEYRRNYLRHKVVPLLRQLNPAIDTTVSTSCALMRKDGSYLDELSSDYSFSNSRTVLSSLPDPILSRVIRNELHARSMKPEYSHIMTACDMIRSDTVRSSLSVPGGTFICDRDSVYTDTDIKDISPTVLKPGVNDYGNDYVIIFQPYGHDYSDEINKYINIYKSYILAQIDSDKIFGEIVASTKKNTDKFRFGGLDRSVKKLIQSKTLTQREVRSLPVIRDDNGIIMIPGFPLRDGITADNDTLSISKIVIINKHIH